MNTKGLTLFIPDKPDVERDAVGSAWEASSGQVLRVARFWDPPAVPRTSVRVYGNETFCLVLQEKLDLILVTPPDDLPLSAPPDLLRRAITKRTLGDTSVLRYPIFVKSLIPKLIPSRVYCGAVELCDASAGLDSATELLVSEPVTIMAEARAFVLRGAILDLALYEGSGDLDSARACVQQLVERMSLPDAVVVDVGVLDDGRWVLVEFNAAWGAGLNGCRAELVLPAIAAASDPSTSDGPFVRRAG